MRLVIPGTVPSKKNNLRRSRQGGLIRDPQTTADINALIVLTREQWGRRAPLEHPEMAVTFYVRDRRSDRDNKLTCLLDVLQEAGVIVNDNVARFNGRVVIEPAVVDPRERTVIEIKSGAVPAGLREVASV